MHNDKSSGRINKDTISAQQPLIYIASVPADEGICREIKQHAGMVARDLGVEIWCDQHVSPGLETLQERSAKLARAEVVLLLISAAFLDEDESWELVITPAMARHSAGQAVVIPIRIQDCDWGNAPFKNISALPKGGEPIQAPPHRDSDLAEIAKTLRDILERLPSISELRSPAAYSANPLGQRRQELAHAAWDDQVLKLADALSQEIDRSLDALRESYRCGRRNSATLELHKLREHPAWSSFTAELRGKILRTMAIFTVQGGEALDTVEELLKQAREIDPGGEDRIARALLAYKRGEYDVALEITTDADQLSPRNFHLALLLENQRLDDARICLSGLKVILEPDAETWRLQAILALMEANTPAAREAIDTALAMSPDWRVLRETSAIIDFWAGFVPSALVGNHPFYPRPVSVRLVRLDDEAEERRNRALKTFADLAASSDGQPNEPVTYETWRFLCLIQAPGTARSDEASSLLQRIFDSGRNVSLSVAWAMNRGVDFDRDHAEAALRQTPAGQMDYLDCQLTLCSMLLDREGVSEVLEILDQRRGDFHTQGMDAIWRYWRGQALVESGRLPEAEAIAKVETDPDIRWRMQLTCAEAHMHANGDWRPLFDLFDSRYQTTRDISALMEACRLKAQAGEWAYLNQYATAVLDASPTPGSVRMMASAAWEDADFSRCRDILDRYAFVFSETRLPEDMRRARLDCLCRLGLLDEASESARRNWEDSRTWGSLMALLDMLVRQGNMAELVDEAGAILSFQAGNVMEALRVAERIRLENSPLAQMIWRWAVARDSDEAGYPIAAMTLGMQLEVPPSELAPIMQQVHRLAESGSTLIRLVKLDEVIGLMTQQRERQTELQRQYDQGLVAVHLLGDQPLLADMYHAIPELNRQEPHPTRRLPLMIRHGARPAYSLGKGYHFQGRLVMDVTALLLAQDLGILERVERRFGPVHVSPRVVAYLGWERSQLTPTQPERIRALKSLDSHVLSGGVRLLDVEPVVTAWDDGFQQAMGGMWLAQILNLRTDAGWVMDFFPLTSNDLEQRVVDIPAEYAASITSPRAVLDALLTEGVFSAEKYQSCLETMGSTVVQGMEMAAPQPGARLLIPVGLAELFEQARVLAFLCNRYRVEVSRTEWEDNYKPEVIQAERNRSTETWLTTLLNRLNSGLAQHRYQLLPEAPPRKEDREIPDSPRLGVLADVLHFQGTARDLVWVDDRFLSGFPAVNASPMVGALEMLHLLRADMGEEPYFRALLKLRECHFRHLPLLTDEILYWLRKAPVSQHQIVETQELACLRQYWASLWLDDRRLRLNEENGQKPEFTLFSQAANPLHEAFGKLWAQKKGRSKNQARSAWLLNNLHVGLTGLGHLMPNHGAENRRLRLAVDLSGLLLVGMFLPTSMPKNTKARENPLKQYMEWLNAFHVAPRLRADPDCVVQVASLISRYLNMILDNAKKDGPEHVSITQALLHRFVRLVPDSIRGELHADKALMNRLGARVIKLVSVDRERYQFPRKEFWRKADMALRQGAQKIRDTGRGTSWIMALPENGQNSALELRQNEQGHRIKLDVPMLSILSPYEPERLAVLQAHRWDWLDGWDRDVTGAERELSDIETPEARIARLESWQALSAAGFYAGVDADAMHRKNAGIHDFEPPPVSALLRYFRLETGAEHLPFPQLWEQAVARMLAEMGLEETLVRAVCLPVPLPTNLRDALLVDPEAEAHYERMLAMATAPVSHLHALDLGLALRERVPGLVSKLEAMLAHLRREQFGHEFKLLQTIQSYAQAVLVNRREFRALSGSLRLALLWGHAQAVQNRFQMHGELTEQAIEAISSQTQSLPWQPRDDTSGWMRDVAHPHQALKPYLVYHALGHILERHREESWNDLQGVAELRRALVAPSLGEVIDAETIWLARESGRQMDSLGSLFGGERQAALVPLLEEQNGWYSSASIRQRVFDTVTELESDSGCIEVWMHMIVLAPDGDVDTDLFPRCQAIAQVTDMVRLYPILST